MIQARPASSTEYPEAVTGQPLGSPGTKLLLEAQDTAYRYPNSDCGMPSTSLAIQPGVFLHVDGPSGSGKSTLARCLTGVIPHLYHGTFTGSVRVNGLSTAKHPLWKLAEQAGMVYQNPAAQMLAASVEEEIVFGLENLGCTLDEISQRLDEVLTRFDLHALRHRSPQSLSGGEQQKLALAAIIARQPPVLILDEPLSMLDVTAATDLIQHLTRLAETGTSIVIFEHRGDYLGAIPDLQSLSLRGSRNADLSPRPPTDLAFCPAPSPIELKVQGLTVQIAGRNILHDVSFTASSGETVAIMGRNGVGKTTLLRALAGLQRHEGTIAVNNGKPDFGMVFQNTDLQIFNASVHDEILYRIPDPDMDHYRCVLNALCLSRYEDTPPLLLSEGEKKRVGLATVLMRQPRHGILLDEPSLGQDQRHKDILMRLARALSYAGQMVILTTHDLTLAAQCDRIILLGPNGIVADGPRSQVMEDRDAWARIGLHVPDWASLSPATEMPQ